MKIGLEKMQQKVNSFYKKISNFISPSDKGRHKVKLFLFHNTFYDTCTYIIEKRGRPVGSARRRSESPTEDFGGILNISTSFRI